MQMRRLLHIIRPPKKWKFIALLSTGVICGLISYLFYVSRAYSYLSDDPKTCVNCHVMTPYYATYAHSSHYNAATCNDCHVPHNNVFSKYFFKAKDGLYHATIFTLRAEPQVIKIHEAGSNVVLKNCQRCHSEMNENVGTTNINVKDKEHGKGKLCWDCHRETPHGRATSLSETPTAITPTPESPVPDWLKKQMDNKK